MRIRDLVLILSNAAAVALAAACFTLLPNLNVRFIDRPVVRVRVVNQTASDFQDVSINHRAYGPLNRGAVSRYHALAGADKGETIRAETAAGSLARSAIDQDEVPAFLPTGAYTYILRADPGDPDGLDVDVQRD